jgi:hypothetical protein
MSKRSKRRARLLGQLCVYCGKVPATTWDDIPPKGFCAKPPGKLLRVPSCSRCNGGASNDDEWVRNDLVLESGNAQHPIARELTDSAYRGLSMPEKKGMLATFQTTVRQQEVRTESGLYVKVPTFYMQADPQRRVVSRIVKALYWHHHDQTRLPDEYTVSSFPVDAAIKENRETSVSAVTLLLRQPQHTLGNGGVFSYRFFIDDHDPPRILWLLVFYQRFGILAVAHKSVGVCRPPVHDRFEGCRQQGIADDTIGPIAGIKEWRSKQSLTRGGRRSRRQPRGRPELALASPRRLAAAKKCPRRRSRPRGRSFRNQRRSRPARW